ncbi:spore germination protein [Fodinisporobacter ferrooxydans]|uniref:Spore germination protein n=1 Tax=Fodinisporobacter ferrooxydans TaxID=2901836 RepID=A0ABY4CW82_9BACL|nr:spore germination protein [Alicyclobacillaceae bacterium MYW30-H2]
MPSVVGAFKVVSNSGQIEIGDTFAIAPKAASKTYTGSGAGNTGDFTSTFNYWNSTNTIDPDGNDQQVVGWPGSSFLW